MNELAPDCDRERLARRRAVLHGFGASPETADELIACNHNQFRPIAEWLRRGGSLADEDCVSAWAQYASEAATGGAETVLRSGARQHV